jgi:hypothetical protein
VNCNVAKVDRLCRQHHLEVEQPAGNAIAPRCLGDVRPLLKALRRDRVPIRASRRFTFIEEDLYRRRMPARSRKSWNAVVTW